MICPAITLEPIMVIISGISTVPLWVALVPITPWMYSGMNRIVPNMPMDMMDIAPTDTLTMLLRNSVSGMMGSIVRVSTRPKATSMIAATANRPMTTGEFHA